LPHEFQVIKTTDGQAAYEKFRSEKPDLVILEAMLPKLHGFELAQRINKETKGSIPIVVVTGIYKGDQHKDEAIRSCGAADFFEKPFDNDKFDIVICVTALHNFNNAEKALQEMARVCKNRVVISLLKKTPRFKNLKRLISESFKIDKIIDESKDKIFFLSLK